MRTILRIVFVILLAFLLQSTLLPYLRIAGMLPDVITITLFTVGFSLGLYYGLMTGVFCALIMEVASGELPALISVICLLAAALGAISVKRIDRIQMPGRRGVERRVKQLAPMILIALFVMAKELLYSAYFYLVGMRLSLMHLMRPIAGGLYTGVSALLVFPVVSGFLLRKPEDTMVARWQKRRREKKEAKPVKPTAGADVPVFSDEGGANDL